jgi:hypothetical protein
MISDIYKPMTGGTVAVGGKIESGFVSVGDNVLFHLFVLFNLICLFVLSLFCYFIYFIFILFILFCFIYVGCFGSKKYSSHFKINNLT